MVHKKISFSVDSLSQALDAIDAGAQQLIVGLPGCSRFGRFPLDELPKLIDESSRKNVLLGLDWDLFLHEKDTPFLKSMMRRIPFSFIHEVRIQDFGMLSFFSDLNVALEINFLCEARFPNQHAIAALCKDRRFSTLTLGHQLTKETMLKHARGSTLKTEMMISGPIPLLQTPKELLARGESESVQKIAHSEEGPHRNFLIEQNQNGTTMFHNKDLQLFSFWEELQQSPLTGLTIDWRRVAESFSELCSWFKLFCSRPNERMPSFFSIYPRPTCSGLFRSNRTDVLFSKLKNSHLQFSRSNAFARVIDVSKDSYLLLQKIGSTLNEDVPNNGWLFIAPDGTEKEILKPQFEVLGTKSEFLKTPYLSRCPFQTLVLPI